MEQTLEIQRAYYQPNQDRSFLPAYRAWLCITAPCLHQKPPSSHCIMGKRSWILTKSGRELPIEAKQQPFAFPCSIPRPLLVGGTQTEVNGGICYLPGMYIYSPFLSNECAFCASYFTCQLAEGELWHGVFDRASPYQLPWQLSALNIAMPGTSVLHKKWGCRSRWICVSKLSVRPALKVRGCSWQHNVALEWRHSSECTAKTSTCLGSSVSKSWDLCEVFIRLGPFMATLYLADVSNRPANACTKPRAASALLSVGWSFPLWHKMSPTN